MIIRGAGNRVKWMNAFPPLVACQINLVPEQSSLGGPWIVKNIAKWPLAVMFKPSTKTILQTPMRKGLLMEFFKNP